MKYLVALAFVGIIGALLMAGVFMVRDGRNGKPKTGNMMRALALRVTLSVLLFACILFGWWAGWIHPSAFPVGK